MNLKDVDLGGAVWFGLVIGWIASVTFHSQPVHSLKDIAVVLAAIGGAAVTKLFPNSSAQFTFYCVGTAFGFFIHVGVSISCWGGKVWPVA